MKKQKEPELYFEIDKLNNISRISIMANFKKIDDKDFVFVNKPLTEKEEKEFSDFLKKRKSGTKAKSNFRIATNPKKELA